MKRKTIVDMRKLARENEGECLSSKYLRAHSLLVWKCAYGHEWEATYANINSGSWCPKCSKGFSEEMCRFIIERMLDVEFKKNRKILCGLELDGYNNDLRLAFEYQGRQHYKFIPHWHKTREVFAKQVRRDIAKKELCEIKGIILLIIPYSVNDFPEYIGNFLRNKGIDIKHLEVDLSAFRTPYRKRLDNLSAVARSRGGQCLSKAYKGVHAKLEWRCSYGHQWQATPASILHGNTWCKRCAGLHKPDIQLVQELAHRRGGICLSGEYKNSKSKLRWKCLEGHVWDACYTSVRQGHWCPVCGKKKSWITRRMKNV